MVKATFTFDEETAQILRRTAVSLRQPQSQVVREAVREYAQRTDRISHAERIRFLKYVDEMISRPPTRTQREVDREIREIRAARRTGGRRHPVD